MPKTASAAEPSLYCRNCSYDLRGQEKRRCPECGRVYDPADPKTFRRRPRGKVGRWVKRIAVGLIVLLLIAAAPYAWLYYEWRREQPAVERMKELSAYVEYKRIDPPVLPSLLPKRFAWVFDRLSYVYTRQQHVTDSDLVLLARCGRMEHLEATYGSVTDKGIEAISQSRELRVVYLSGSGITDASAAHLARCRRLSAVALSKTSLTDEGLGRLCALPDLAVLYIESSRPTDAGLPALANLPKLASLSIYAPAIDDDGLAILSRLPHLEELYVRGDHWTPEGASRLRQSLPNCDVGLYRYSPAPASATSTAPAN